MIEGLDNCKKLKRLSISDHEIEKMDGLNHIKNLRSLSLEFNKIRKIEGIDKLDELRLLYLRENKLPLVMIRNDEGIMDTGSKELNIVEMLKEWKSNGFKGVMDDR